MQIALWSNETSGSGVTTLAGVLATTIAATRNYKTFLTHCLTDDLSMEDYLLQPNERKHSKAIGDSNIEGLFRLIKNGKLTKESVKDYCFSLLSHSNLDFLNSHKGQMTEDESFMLNYTYLLYVARQFYDVVMIDLEISIEHPLFQKVLKDSDVLVVVCPQNKYRMQRLQETIAEYQHIFEETKTRIIFVVNKKDQQLEDKKLLGRLLHKPLYISYASEIVDSCNRGELVDFILRHCYSPKKTKQRNFMQEAQGLIKELFSGYEEGIQHVI